jgi:RNA polymerase sigma factor (sigma-70 family)
LRVESDKVVLKQRDPFVWLAPALALDAASYEEYAERLTRSLRCYFAGNGCPAADDLASEVLLRLIEKLDDNQSIPCDTESTRRQYLFGIARNVLREWQRRPGARETDFQEDEGSRYSLPPVDLIAQECLEILKSAVTDNLARLSPSEQHIIHNSELNPDYTATLAELAAAEQMTAAAMRKRSSRARIRFRKLILESGRLGDLLRCLGIERASL